MFLKHPFDLGPLPRLKPVGFRTQAEIAGKACLTFPTPTDKTLPVFAIENRDDRNRIFTSRESIVQSYHAGRAKNDSVAEAATREPFLHPTAKARWALRVPQPSLSCNGHSRSLRIGGSLDCSIARAIAYDSSAIEIAQCRCAFKLGGSDRSNL